jgi:hypothetical protein
MIDKNKLQKLKDLATQLDADKAGAGSLILLKKINDLKDELAKLQELLGVIENKSTEKTGEVLNTLNETYSTLESKIADLSKQDIKLSKDTQYAENYFKNELATIKNVIADLRNEKPKVIDRVIEKTEVIREIPFVDAPQIAQNGAKIALEQLKPLIPKILPFPTSTAIIEGINTEEGTLIKREKVEGLEELERKADFALSRPLVMGGGGEVLKLKAGQNIHIDKVGGVNTISVTGSLGVSNYSELDDVNMTGLADGNVPIWDDTTGKWIPGVATDPLSLHLDQTTPQTFTGGTVTGTGLLQVVGGVLGKNVMITVSATAPANPQMGDLWVDLTE